MVFSPDEEIKYASYSPDMLSKIDLWLDTREDASYVASFRELIAKFHETFREIDDTLQALLLEDEIDQVDSYALVLSYLAKDIEDERAAVREIEEITREAG